MLWALEPRVGVSACLARWPSQASSLPRVSDRWPWVCGELQPAQPCTLGSVIGHLQGGVLLLAIPGEQARASAEGTQASPHTQGQVRGLHKDFQL